LPAVFTDFRKKNSENDGNREELGDKVTIYVSGAVNKPGVFSISAKARAMDAVAIAGGLTPQADVGRVNMAQPVKEGMHLYVAEKSVSVTPLIKNDNNNKPRAATVNINTANEKELDALPGIGPALAKRIVEYRQANGGFGNIEEIRKVRGISGKKFEKIKDMLTIG
jgi:competence protein ComEA